MRENFDSISAAPAQVLLRWATQRGIAVIPKSNSHERLVANLDCCSFNLSEAELKELNSLNINLRVRHRLNNCSKSWI